MAVQTLLWPDEIRRPLAIASRVRVDLKPEELAAAAALVHTMTKDFDPAEHADEYQTQLKDLLDHAIAAQRPAPAVHGSSRSAERSGDPVVDDLVEALRRSVRSVTEQPPP